MRFSLLCSYFTVIQFELKKKIKYMHKIVNNETLHIYSGREYHVLSHEGALCSCLRRKMRGLTTAAKKLSPQHEEDYEKKNFNS